MTAGFLLLILMTGIPVPMLAVPLPDARSCAMNMEMMRRLVNDKAEVACFDLTAQVVHMPPKEEKKEGEEEMK